MLYDCANDSVAHRISRLAAKVRLTRSELGVVIQARAEEIRTLAPAADDTEESPRSSSDTDMPSSSKIEMEPTRTPGPTVRIPAAQAAEPPKPDLETSEEAAERERRYREIFVIPEPPSRRRWRRAR